MRKFLSGVDSTVDSRFRGGILLDEIAAPSTPASGQLAVWTDTNHWVRTKDNSGVVRSIGPRISRVSTDRSNTTVTPADVTDMTFPVENGGYYAFRFTGVYITAATTTGIRLGINGPTIGSDGLLVWVNLADLNTGVSQVSGASTAYDTHNQPSGSGPGGTFEPFLVEGTFHAGATGTLALRQWSEVATSAVTIKKNSLGFLWQIA